MKYQDREIVGEIISEEVGKKISILFKLLSLIIIDIFLSIYYILSPAPTDTWGMIGLILYAFLIGALVWNIFNLLDSLRN